MDRIYTSAGMKKIIVWSFALSGLIASQSMATTSDDLREILTKCDLQPDQACEQLAWNFADVSEDQKLSKAEITRFLRLASMSQATGMADAERSAEVVTFFLGPWGAQSVLDNFDFDGDGFLTKAELFRDVGASDIKQFTATIISSSKDALALGGAMAMGQMGQMNSLGTKGRQQKPIATRRPQTATVPRATIKQGKSTATRATTPIATNDSPAFRVVADQAKLCWIPPLGMRDTDDLEVSIKVTLNLDGSVRGEPAILNPQRITEGGEPVRQFAASTQRAIVDCAPYNLPAEHYKKWQTVLLTFDARGLLGQ